ncbi:hypothetical protein BD309DRAFT_207141 [Dichomitus squalens]|nr:hypothetical protein BD309DRAFT_207141 [Dichomitus squalens]
MDRWDWSAGVVAGHVESRLLFDPSQLQLALSLADLNIVRLVWEAGGLACPLGSSSFPHCQTFLLIPHEACLRRSTMYTGWHLACGTNGPHPYVQHCLHSTTTRPWPRELANASTAECPQNMRPVPCAARVGCRGAITAGFVPYLTAKLGIRVLLLLHSAFRLVLRRRCSLVRVECLGLHSVSQLRPASGRSRDSIERW